MRRARDFYETAEWQIRALLAHQAIAGTILEPCVGDGSIARVLADVDGVHVVTNDVDPARPAACHCDAATADLYRAVGPVDWVITNPPYRMPACTAIVARAVEHARVGVAMMLRISFREPTAKVHPRGPFLQAHPISRLLTLPRCSFTGNGKTDSATTEWAIWLTRPLRANEPPVLSLYGADRLGARVGGTPNAAVRDPTSQTAPGGAIVGQVRR